MSHLMQTMKDVVEREQETAAGAVEVAQELAAGISVDPPPQPTEPVWHAGDPDVSDMVIYQPRRGEIRRGRKRIAAMVTHRYPDARVLDLAIIYEASDTMDQQRVPEAVGEERGWLVKHSPIPMIARMSDEDEKALRESPQSDAIVWQQAATAVDPLARQTIETIKMEISELRTLVMGEFETPKASILDMLCELDERVDSLAPAASTKPAPKSKKRGK